ncbi:MAG: prepilin-type N-terminal cleavage/methylation domain-containing protein [bacterium]|nr:prepilin-type N-terminal cleavage/methylation domain-containing protein [bacterium]
MNEIIINFVFITNLLYHTALKYGIIIARIMTNNNAGFTLIETLIYIAIISIIMTAFVSFAISISNTRNKTYVVQEVQANARFALDTMSRKIREAEAVTSPTTGASANSLLLDMQGVSPDITFDVNNGILRMTEGINLPISLTANEVDIDSISFTNFGGSGKRENIKIEMNVSFRDNGSKAFTYADTYQTSVSIRK